MGGEDERGGILCVICGLLSSLLLTFFFVSSRVGSMKGTALDLHADSLITILFKSEEVEHLNIQSEPFSVHFKEEYIKLIQIFLTFVVYIDGFHAD